MKSNDRTILFAVIGVAAVIALYFLLISPKRAEVGELDTQVADAQAAVAEQEQLVALAEEAKTEYRSDFQHLVVLGKAVPGDDDVSSLIEQVNSKAADAEIDFRGLTLAAGTDGGTSVPPPVATEPAPAPGEAPAEGGVPAEGTTVPATEAAVAVLPLGAAVGPAGLPTMPYDLTFAGEFFEIADFMAGLDSMVEVADDGVGVDGRLLTIDGFSLSCPADDCPHLQANLHVTSFVAPADQGLTAGATPAAPAESTPTATTPSTAPPLATSSVPTP